MTSGKDASRRPLAPGEVVREAGANIPRGLEKALLAAIVENSDDAIASKNLAGIVTSWNRAAERLFGYAANEIIGRPISMLAAPGRENEMPQILERIRRGERVDHYETVRRRKDGSLVQVALTISSVRDPHGQIVGASKIVRDISGRRQLEEERERRIGELRHRVKNLLAIVSAIARQTAVEGHSAEEYRQDFLGRLTALVAAHEAGFQTEAGVDLATLVTRLLDPYAHRAWGDVVTIEGPAADIPRQRIQALAFVVHELATNAVKHGALSVPEGRLRISWPIEASGNGSYLQLSWQEREGPAVVPPAARGFGMKLIMAEAVELGGKPELIFAPQGLEAKITVRLG
jgi:PAS domain S-box-containing protein